MKTLLKPVSRFIVLIVLTVLYGIYLSPRMSTDSSSFVLCIGVWIFLMICIALSTLPLISALLILNEKE